MASELDGREADCADRASALEALLLREHAEEWGRYLVAGEVEGMEELLEESEEDEEAGSPGGFDGLLDGGADEEPWLPELGEEGDPSRFTSPCRGSRRRVDAQGGTFVELC